MLTFLNTTLFKTAAVYTISNLTNAAIPFFLLPILTRVLPPSEYGLLAMFHAFLGILAAFTGLSVQGAVGVRYVDREQIDYPRYIGSCLLILLCSTILTFIVVFLSRNFLTKFTNLPSFWLITAVGISFGNFLLSIRLVLWQMGKEPIRYGIFQVSYSALNMGLSLALVLLSKQGYEGRLLGQAIAVLCFSSIGLATLFHSDMVTLQPRMHYIKEALAFGAPLVPHVIGIFLIGLADRFIINQKLGLAAEIGRASCRERV